MPSSYGRILFILAGIGLLILFAWKIGQRVEGFLFPWANEKSGRPLLIGFWTGDLEFSDHSVRAVSLDLHRWQEDRKQPCPDCKLIEGSLRTCDADGTLVSYRASGNPADRAAKRFFLGFSPMRFTGSIDHQLRSAQGQWNGDSMQLQIVFETPVDALTVHTNNAEPSAPITLYRSDANRSQQSCEPKN